MPLSAREFSAADLTLAEAERFYHRVDRSAGPDACWPWTLSAGSHGYGQMWVRSLGHVTTAHRVAYVLEVGPIAPGMTIDHDRRICEGGRCCNPAHLRQLPNEVNARDNGQSLKTHCPAGHPYDQENTFVNKRGWRQCRQCQRDRRALEAISV